MEVDDGGDEDKMRKLKRDNLKLAMVAIDLKMYEDAEELLKQCKRYDLIKKCIKH